MTDHSPETPPAKDSSIDQPSAPSTLPAYVRDPVKRQSATRLRALAEWATQLADWKEQDAERALTEQPDPDGGEITAEHVVDGAELDHEEIPASATVYIYCYKVPCGPGCDGCPHGPYQWGKWRDDDTVRTTYLGPPD